MYKALFVRRYMIFTSASASVNIIYLETIVYSYLMAVQAVDQNIFPEVFPNTKGKIVWSIACTPIK